MFLYLKCSSVLAASVFSRCKAAGQLQVASPRDGGGLCVGRVIEARCASASDSPGAAAIPSVAEWLLLLLSL